MFCVLFSFTGQKDDCSSNRRLCGYPLNFPTDRRLQSLGPNVGISNLIGDPAAGLIFTWYVVLCVLFVLLLVFVTCMLCLSNAYLSWLCKNKQKLILVVCCFQCEKWPDRYLVCKTR